MRCLKRLLPLTMASSIAMFAADEPASSGGAQKESARAPAPAVPFKLLNAAELNEVLARRVQPGMDGSFEQFANRFFVSSRTAIGVSIGLSAATRDIAKAKLQSPFPEFYKPRLSEFLDAIALQTFSEWSYDKDAQFRSAPNYVLRQEAAATITFSPVQNRQKRFQLTLAEGWKAQDRGNWLMLIPPTAPAGMDIYELGSYSTEKAEDQAALMTKVRWEIALMWAKRVNPKATEADLKPVKVETFDSLYYQTMTASAEGRDIRWRHWTLTTKRQCFLIVSAVFPEEERGLLPQVGKMLESLKFTDP
jgi:hypothetical protein